MDDEVLQTALHALRVWGKRSIKCQAKARQVENDAQECVERCRRELDRSVADEEAARQRLATAKADADQAEAEEARAGALLDAKRNGDDTPPEELGSVAVDFMRKKRSRVALCEADEAARMHQSATKLKLSLIHI